eukprot:383031-Rhodomonas_salina.1
MESNKKARHSKNQAQVLLETDLGYIEDEDDLLQAFGIEELHIDYAHSITLGYNKERYYLLVVVGCRNFMWVSPTTTRKEPEVLLQEFLALLTDNEFTASSTFKAFCYKRNIITHPSVAYTHTMQALAEGAVRICKEH